MELASLIPSASRVIDVGAPTSTVAQQLALSGVERYLGLVPPDRLAAARSEDGAPAHRFHPLDSASQAIRNSADVIVLRRSFSRFLWSLRDLNHARYVAVEIGRDSAGAEALAATATGALTGRAALRGRHTCGDLEVLVIELRGHRPAVPRHYLSPVWGVEGFIRRAEGAGLDYAALRWFEDLPALAPGEDLDLLVADEDLAKMQALLAEEPGTIPVDLYSVSGMPGADYQRAAYYPPTLATQLLDRAVRHSSGCRVPAPVDHLHSLAYHAVYHKGPRSGLPSDLVVPVPDPEHDYAEALQHLAGALQVDLPTTLEDIDEHLAVVGWRPPQDALRRLAPSNPWIRRRFMSGTTTSSEPPEPTVFFIREQALPVVDVEEVRSTLSALGFETLRAVPLDVATQRRCASQTRGGNWGRGPYPRSGGRPAMAIVTLHHGPRPPHPTLQAQYPQLSNSDTYYAKERIRELVNGRLPDDQHINAVHSSDNEEEAWEYVAVALPEDRDEVAAEVERRRAEYRTDDVPVIRELSRGRRAKVELVQGPQGPVVRKTFAAGYLAHLHRELDAMDALRPSLDAVPEVLERGQSWFTMPYYENELPDLDSGALVPLPAVRRMVDVLRQVHALGGDLVDARPQNFLLDPRHGLKLIDFEFFHRYPGPRPRFRDSYGFVGVPAGFDGDAPVTTYSYDGRWRTFTGLPLDALVDGSVPVQHLHRTVYRLWSGAFGPGAPARHLARSARDGARRGRRELGGRYTRWARRRAESSPGAGRGDRREPT